MRLSSKIMIVFGLVLFLFAVVTAINLQLSHNVKADTFKLSHTDNLLRESALIQKSIIDMESGFRGYLLTGQDSFLEPFNTGQKNYAIHYQQLYSMIPLAEKHNRALIDSINGQVGFWRDSFAAPMIYKGSIASKNKNYRLAYNNLLQSAMAQESGKKIIDGLRIRFLDFDRMEYEQSKARRASLTKALDRTETLTLTLLICSLFIGIVAAMAITRKIIRRISQMVNLATRISEGDFNFTIRDNTHDEMHKLTISLNRMTRKLRENFTSLAQSNEELEQFAFVSSHDMKEPLRMVTNYTQLLAIRSRDKLNDVEKEYIEYAMEGASRMKSLIEDIAEYSEVTRDKKYFRKVDCNNSVKEALEKLKALLLNRKAEVVFNELPVIEGANTQISRLFFNLIENSIKFNNEHAPKTVITCRRRDNEYLFSVRDNGIGLEEKYHQKVFAIFQRLHERGKYAGTGLGLALCKKIVELHGGKIWYKSTPGHGSTFYFTLPLPSMHHTESEEEE